jgi:hypothetical protein
MDLMEYVQQSHIYQSNPNQAIIRPIPSKEQLSNRSFYNNNENLKDKERGNEVILQRQEICNGEEETLKRKSPMGENLNPSSKKGKSNCSDNNNDLLQKSKENHNEQVATVPIRPHYYEDASAGLYQCFYPYEAPYPIYVHESQLRLQQQQDQSTNYKMHLMQQGNAQQVEEELSKKLLQNPVEAELLSLNLFELENQPRNKQRKSYQREIRQAFYPKFALSKTRRFGKYR